MDDVAVNRLIAFLMIVALTAQSVLGGDPVPRRTNSQVRQASARTSRAAEMPSPRRRVAPNSAVRPAQHVEMMPGEVIQRGVVQDQGIVYEGGYDVGYEGGYDVGCDSCGNGGCDGGCSTDSCGSGGCFDLNICNSCFEPSRLCICLPNHGWFQADYLNWYQKGMDLPPLLAGSTAGTAANRTGVLGLASTNVIVGGNDILSDARSGGRVRFGWWFANRPNLGLELEYFGLETGTESTLNQGTGTPLLGRPFFNTTTGANDSELVSSPNLVSGSFRTTATSSLDGAAVRFRKSLCCGSGSTYSWLACGSVPTQSRIDATLGWRYLQLDEMLSLDERIDSQLTSEPGSFQINDTFRTRNQFNGVEMGVMWQGRRGYWTLDLNMRVGVGNILQKASIYGSTTIQQTGQPTQNFDTGFLTQRSNIGEFSREVFGVMPEWNANLGYQLTPRTRVTAGYTFMFLSSVLRPGDQIDLDLNPNLLAPAQAIGNGVERPVNRFVESDYWVQGLNVGAEYRW